MDTTRICLWSSPRNISTAMMYSFAQRPDTIVFDEPLYAHYLRATGVVHPGQKEILQSQENDGNKVVNELMLGSFDKSVAFFKQMTHHLVELDEKFLSRMKNILFIRDPKQIISSYAQVRPDVNMQDIGIEKQWHLFEQLTTNNQNCVVLDSNEILKAPKKVLAELCQAIDIPFYNEMLHWPTGPKSEDGVWAKYWYDNVHKSTGFEKQATSSRTLPGYLESLYNESKKYYDQLFQHSIKA
ncbi:sulfotransferase family protein [Panacibacter ginsenosidivorans]|uniref:Sulfotransferase family protein n=1 Tax=Panacibacter ginsenosidivorans TaxID=1813871 RepID=A0A5B8V8I2_9BACT|nr:sulfotransferase family protein [Panacibacter ginsenosidivorans]QEC67141.1 sulfotransferase family protein [Panacibacter ginsenosidivorans]